MLVAAPVGCVAGLVASRLLGRLRRREGKERSKVAVCGRRLITLYKDTARKRRSWQVEALSGQPMGRK